MKIELQKGEVRIAHSKSGNALIIAFDSKSFTQEKEVRMLWRHHFCDAIDQMIAAQVIARKHGKLVRIDGSGL